MKTRPNFQDKFHPLLSKFRFSPFLPNSAWSGPLKTRKFSNKTRKYHSIHLYINHICCKRMISIQTRSKFAPNIIWMQQLNRILQYYSIFSQLATAIFIFSDNHIKV